jgi:hypothetical protein
MDDIKEPKKRAPKEKKTKPKKEKKTTKKGKGRKTSKKSVPSPFVQTTPPSKVPSGSGILGGSRDLFGAGGLPAFLEALGVKGKFQSLGGTSGFAPQQPLNAPIPRPQYAEPKLPERTIEPKPAREYSPAETIAQEESIFKRLERASRGIAKGDLVRKVNQYFGDEGLDYVIKDEILKNRTKTGILRKMAEYGQRGFGNIDIDEFIDFNPETDLEERPEEDLFSTGSGPGVRVVMGEDTSSLGSNGFTYGIQGGRTGQDQDEEGTGEEESQFPPIEEAD